MWQGGGHTHKKIAPPQHYDGCQQGLDAIGSSGLLVERRECQRVGGVDDDTVYGGVGADIIYGQGGSDQIYGDGANYNLQAGDDDLIYAGAGSDTVRGGGGNDILYGDNGNDVLTGDYGNDSIVGGDGDDALWGVWGNDTLTGGAGNDTFVFNAAPGAGNLDKINDFVAGDSFRLSKSVFSLATAQGAPLSASEFISGTGATTAQHRIIYNTSDGYLYWDADGIGSGSAIKFAEVGMGKPIDAGAFLVF